MFRPYFRFMFRLIFEQVECIIDNASNLRDLLLQEGTRGGVVVKALRHKPAGRGFDSRCCPWNFSVIESFRSQYGPGVHSASDRNEYQVFFLGVKAAGA